MPDLFTLETPEVRLRWSRRKPLDMAVSQAPAVAPFGLVAEGTATVYLEEGREQHLFEQTDYTLLLQSRNGLPVTLCHRDPNLLAPMARLDDGRTWHGTINFGSQVGTSRFIIEQAGRPVLQFQTEIFPTKLDYRQDFNAMVADVQRVVTGLVLAYLRATEQQGQPVVRDAPVPLEGLALLRYHLDELERALQFVAAHPHRQLQRTPAPVRVAFVRRPDAALHQVLERSGSLGLSAAMLPHHRPVPSLDTPEHRWLRSFLEHLRQRLGLLRRRLPVRSRRQRQTAAEWEELARRLSRLLRLEPLAGAGVPELPPVPTPVLQSAPGYREAYAACLRLGLGMALAEGVVPFALQDLHRLYEYWCYLTLLRLLSEETGQPVPVDDLIAVDPTGLHVRLGQGTKHQVRFTRASDETITVLYNPRFSGPGLLVPQQPDLLLVREGPGLRPRAHVLDAKYRVDASPSYVRRFGMPGPPEDALNDLHRYRDALRSESEVVQAIALFPWKGEAEAVHTSRLWRSIPSTGIGAIPLLPGMEAYLRAWVHQVLSH